jgi:hypothetical protein
MPGKPREMITVAERRFPVRIRIAVPPKGPGQRHTQMTGWLDENCGADGGAMTPSGTRGVLMTPCRSTSLMPPSRARSLPGGASGPRSRRQVGVFEVREDEPAPRAGTGLHRTP